MPNRMTIAAASVTLAVLSAIATADNPTTKPAAAASQPAVPMKVTELTPGEPGAKKGDIVLVLYTGKLANGTVFDSTEKNGGKPFRFVLGTGQVIKGWDQGVAGMPVGQKRQLVIPPELAYGAEGAGGGTIPPNATLTFDVELLGLIRIPPAK